MTHALLSIAENPLTPVLAARPLPAGTRIRDVVPPETPGAMVKVDGAWISRTQWDHALEAGEHLEVHFVPAGNDGRKIARFAIMVFVAWATQGAGLAAWQTAAISLAASVAVNAILPLKAPNISGPGSADSPTYNTSLAGNRPALNEPIPVGYGRMRTYPPFAAGPYHEYDANNDQYYYALLCVGMGEYEFESVEIDDTDIDHFDDIEWAQLAPGVAPTLVLPNVVTSVEVSEIETNAGRATPGIAACRGGLKATHVGVDFIFAGGLADATGTPVTDYSVTLRVDWRPLDDWGVPIAAWSVLGTEVITDAATSPVRRSYKYALPVASRPEIRIVRTTPRDENPLIRNDAHWTGLRAYLQQAAPLAASATYIEVKMRATEQLNGLSQRRLAVVWRRKVRTWAPGSGWSASTVFTRNPAWAIADKLSNAEYGNGLPDSRIDLDTFHALAQVWDARQDRLDIVFDNLFESDEADQVMARVGRARCCWRNGVRTIVRDEPQELPAAIFSGRDIVPGSARLNYAADARRVPDGIIVEYLAHQGWEWETVECPAPGVGTMTRPEYLRLIGITGAKHAEREGLYEAAARVLRRKYASFTTELQGLLPAYGSAVVTSLPLRGWGQHGDVTEWDSVTLEMKLSEPPDFTGTPPHYITLMRDDGSVHDAIEVTAGAESDIVVLAEAPDFLPETDDSVRERTRFVFGTTTEHRRTMLVLGIRPREIADDGAMLIEVSTVNDDDAIHEADNALLPGLGEVQDPIDSPNEPVDGGGAGGGGGGEDVFIAYLTTRSVSSSVSAGAGVPQFVRVRFLADGTLDSQRGADGSVTGSGGPYVNEWVLTAPIDPADAALFEVRATVLSVSGTHPDPEIETSGTWSGDALDTWLPLGVLRTFDWNVPASDGLNETGVLRLQIRDVATSTLQASASWTFNLSSGEFGA